MLKRKSSSSNLLKPSVVISTYKSSSRSKSKSSSKSSSTSSSKLISHDELEGIRAELEDRDDEVCGFLKSNKKMIII